MLMFRRFSSSTGVVAATESVARCAVVVAVVVLVVFVVSMYRWRWPERDIKALPTCLSIVNKVNIFL